MSDREGVLFRFPDRDFQLGFARVPVIGETVTAKGRRWTVVAVSHGTDNRAVISLAAIEKRPKQRRRSTLGSTLRGRWPEGALQSGLLT